MSKHGIDLLKGRLRDKISGLQNDAETVKARLENEEHIQANLKRCEEKLSTKLEKSFTLLYKMLEQYKKELNSKVDALFCHQRQVITKQNGALHECLASVNKACSDAEELLREKDRSTFLAAHSKITQRLEECFVELLMLDEAEPCSVAVESLEKKIESFHLEDRPPSVDTGMKTDEGKEKEQHCKSPKLSISSSLTQTTSTTPNVFTFDAVSRSVHLPFVFNSPPSSVPASSGTDSYHNFYTSPVSLSNFISSPLVTPSSNTGSVTLSSSVTLHCPASTLSITSTNDKTVVSLPDVSSVPECVPMVTQSAPITKAQSLASLATCGLKDTSSVIISSSVHSSKITPPKSSANNVATVKKVKTITSRLSSSASVVSLHSKQRTTSHVKIACLSDVKQGNEMECVVTEVVSPSEFWIQPAKYELIRLMKNLEFYYTQLERKGEHEGVKGLPKVGDYCCAQYSQDCKWYRARIVSVDVCGLSQQVEVLYVDYGNQEVVCLSSLRPLDSRFAYLPCQAIKCSLKVKPFIELSSPELKGSGIPQWPKHTKKWFKSLLMGQHAVALFLTANSSNHAQVDIAISREMFLPSLSCLRGVLSITEGIQQYLQSTHFFALFGVSSFMCAVKLATFSGDKWSTNMFCAPSVFTFPAPMFMHPFSGMPPQHSLFPIVKYCSPPSLVSPGFIQPLVSPTSSISDEVTSPNESRCHSEKPMTTQKSVLKKRTASLSGLGSNEFHNLPVQSDASCSAKVSRLSSPQLDDKSSASCGASSDVTLEAAVVLSTSPNNSLSTSFVDVTTVGLECNSSLSASTALSQSSDSSTPSSHALSNTVAITTVTAFTQSSPSSSVSTANSHCEVVNSPQASSPVSTVAIASKSPKCNNKATDDITQSFSSPLSATLSVSTANSHCELVNSLQASSPVAVASKPPECNKSVVAADDCIKYHTIAALPILSTVISNDSDHYSVIVSHVVSPSEFYLNFALDTEEVKNFDSFQQSLHDHYSAKNEAEDDDLSENLTVGVLCSARYTDGTWNRGIIRDTRCTNSDENKTTKYLIQYIDYGNYHWVSINNIRSLQEEFLSQPALTICCTLSGVTPGRAKKWQRGKRTHLSSTLLMAPAGSEDNDMQELDQDGEDLFIHGDQNVFESAKESKDCSLQEWSQEATDQFMHLTDGKILIAAINEEVMMLSWDDVLEVELIDTNGATDVIIADDLVSKGLAQYKTNNSRIDKDSTNSRSSAVSSKGHPLSPTEVAMDGWNPMESHFLSNWNLYKENTDDGWPGRGKGSLAYKARRHQQDDSAAVMVTKSWKTQMASLPAENTCVPIVITAVYSPVKFWAQLPLTTTVNSEEKDNRNRYEVTYSQLCEEMNKQYRQSVFKEREPEMVAHGELVAALSPDDQCWYRALLKDFDDNTNSVLVAFVDYGDTAWVLETNIRRLHPKFIHLPIQAVECTLDGLKVNEEVDFNWAVQEFLEIVKDKAFAGHVIERDTILHKLSLELYDSGSSGTSVNLKNILLSKKIVARATTAIGGSNMAAVGGHKKNTSSLPG